MSEVNSNTSVAKLPQNPVPKPSVLDKLAQQYNTSRADLLNTLKETCFKGATDAQMISLCIVAGQYNLNPFLKEIYAFPAKGGGIVPVVGVDGWAKLMNSRPEFDGVEFDFAGSIEGDGPDMACTATVWIKNRSKPVRITEYYSECMRQTEPWKTCPRRMLRHKALIQAARIAFGFSGIHDPEEAETISVHSEPVPEAKATLHQIEAKPETAKEPQPEPPPKPKAATSRKAEPSGNAGSFEAWLKSNSIPEGKALDTVHRLWPATDSTSTAAECERHHPQVVKYIVEHGEEFKAEIAAS